MNNLTEEMIRKALAAEADTFEVPSDLAERTIAAAKSGQATTHESIVSRWRPHVSWSRWMYAPAAAVLAVALFMVGAGLPSLFLPTRSTVGGSVAQDADGGGRQMTAPSVGNDTTAQGEAKSGDEVAGSQVADSGSAAQVGNNSSSVTQQSPIDQGNPGIPPALVKTAYLDVEVGKGRFEEVWDRANAIPGQHGGFVINASTSQFKGTPDPKPIPLGAPEPAIAPDVMINNATAAGNLTARVPSDQLDATLAAFRKLGSVVRVSTSGNDVAGTLSDLGARLRAAEAQEAQLTELLKQATSVDDILRIRTRQNEAITQIEQLKTQQQSLQAQVDFSTVTLSIAEKSGKGKTSTDDGTGFADAIKAATTIAVTIVKGLIIAAILLLPLSVIAAAIWGLVALIRRRRSRAA